MKRTQRKTKATALPKSKATNAYELLSEIRALILEEPLRYNQRCWLAKKRGRFSDDPGPSDEFPACGTIGCVAGWVRQLKAPRHSGDLLQTGDIAREILGLNEDQAMVLFNASSVMGNGQTQEHARNGANHIRDFQESFKAQLKAKAV